MTNAADSQAISGMEGLPPPRIRRLLLTGSGPTARLWVLAEQVEGLRACHQDRADIPVHQSEWLVLAAAIAQLDSPASEAQAISLAPTQAHPQEK